MDRQTTFRAASTRVALGAAIAAATLIAPATAAPVSYAEPPDIPVGDFQQATGGESFTLDIGINTISGNSSAPPKESQEPSDYDDIKFVVPAGSQLLGLSVTTTLAGGNSIVPFGWDLWSDGFALGIDLGSLLVAAAPGTGSFGAVPLAAGDYYLYQRALETEVSVNYTITFTLREAQAVPEPGTVALLGLGLAGLAASRRRKR